MNEINVLLLLIIYPILMQAPGSDLAGERPWAQSPLKFYGNGNIISQITVTTYILCGCRCLAVTIGVLVVYMDTSYVSLLFDAVIL